MKPKYLIQVLSHGGVEWWYRIKRRCNGKILVASETFKSKAHALKMAKMFGEDLKGSVVVLCRSRKKSCNELA